MSTTTRRNAAGWNVSAALRDMGVLGVPTHSPPPTASISAHASGGGYGSGAAPHALLMCGAFVAVALLLALGLGIAVAVAGTPPPPPPSMPAPMQPPPAPMVLTDTQPVSPCENFYDHVCHESAERSAFRSLDTQNRRHLRTFLESTSTYQACVAEGGLRDAAPVFTARAEGDEEESWFDFITATLRDGGVFPLRIYVAKAYHNTSYAVVVEPDASLEVYLRDQYYDVYELLYPPHLTTAIWEDQQSQDLRTYVARYRTWAQLDAEAGQPGTLTSLIGALLNAMLSPYTLIHMPTEASYAAWYDHVLGVCAGAGDERCGRVREALVSATHDLQPGVGNYRSRAHGHAPSLAGTVAWYDALRVQGDTLTARTAPLAATAELEDECRTIAGALHRDEANAHVSAQLYSAAVLPQVEDEIESLTNYMRSSLAQLIHENRWMHASTRDTAISKLEELQIYVLTTQHEPSGGERGSGEGGEEGEGGEGEKGEGGEGERGNEGEDGTTHWVYRLAQDRRDKARANRKLLTRDYVAYRHQYNQYRQDLLQATDVSVVNAWYDPTENTITIPVGILQYPFYHPPTGSETLEVERTRYWSNLASIGTILGHEMGHALDVNGRFFSETGSWSAAGWWAPVDQEGPDGFASHLECMARDYGHPCHREDYGMHTLGEDMADQLGLRAAYRLQEFSHTADIQQFYATYATLWCAKLTAEEQCQRVASDVHALPRHRVNKSLRQLHSFATAFECGADSPMVNSEECLVY